MTEKYRVIDGFDYKNEPCKLIEYIETEERYSTENDLEANSLCKLLNEKEERIEELEIEVLDLRVEVGRLNHKKEIEKPHWLKYESSEGYTKKVNQDIRFKGDMK